MSKRTGPTNILLRRTIDRLLKVYRDSGSGVWRNIAEYLEKPTRKRIAVNLSKINRFYEDGKVIVVPGKVLGSGNLDKKAIVAAFSFSEKAKEKIQRAGGRLFTINDLLKENIDSSRIKIIV